MTMIITDGLPRGLGYVELDHRATGAELLPPGTPTHFEADTYTCSHCNAVVVLNPLRVRERYKCSGCSHHICDNCAAKVIAGKGCRTMAQIVDEIKEADARGLDTSLVLLP